MCFEEHLREYQKLVLTHFLKKIDLRLYRTADDSRRSNERKSPEIVSVKDNKMNTILINKISCGLNHNLLLTND
jgi:hypothetical protein